MHNLDTNFNFDINQPDNSHAFSRGEFTTFQTNTKLIYNMYPISSRIQFHNSADTIFRRFSPHTLAISFTAPSLSTCECCNNKHAAINYDIN
jgi:hypothetical protein